MSEAVVSILLVAGASFMMLAAIGILRLPDLTTRMHASTKAGAMGAMLVMIGVAVHFADSAVSTRALAFIVFVLLTAPVAAHVIARAGYFTGIDLWPGSVKDELRERYDPDTHTLSSGLEHDSQHTENSEPPS
ncbi:multisubunit sodium/proton antiporter MrpG subunit [Tamilnaduibacter salinus]|uniref:Multisubunit sodium/proton antiporter MrpG subunit n=1 Tax=Tamilnaduibacter salinus TaxID=1484056 RepID=A0A2A2I2H1_9GAMM|nr:monovalent cation/H(+) antiporter subunit G [Tamilnaduibacter salinus]PAV25792.1 Na+/H+ antiporter subunit G [Tamilnaduibacter salinus]PVY75773.1 multisubunit sodium/proton antiporter MrpG subunit [Tamilnaduibacter salinus]